jgi:magnesium chelatase family protein
VTFPADFQLVACSNPCPCGLGGPLCRCGDATRARYRRRLSEPLLDRFDLRLAVTPPEPNDEPGECSHAVRERVLAAEARQRRRYADLPWTRNAHVPPRALMQVMQLAPDVDAAWRDVAQNRRLTGRGAARLLRVARTLADLADEPDVSDAHVFTAASLRDDVL